MLIQEKYKEKTICPSDTKFTLKKQFNIADVINKYWLSLVLKKGY